jgi:hypothetical protein
VIDDLSAYIISGRVRAQPGDGPETAARTPRQRVQDGVDAGDFDRIQRESSYQNPNDG